MSCSRAPARAEWRARETSSPGVRTESSSSVGSTPRSRTSRLATRLSRAITGRKRAEKRRCGVATKRATWSGRETAQFLGTSSPTTIWTAEASSIPITTDTPETAPSGSPVAVSGPCNSPASAGSASMPTTSEVRVMPSWVPESWKDSSRSVVTTARARRSPVAAARSASARSTVTRPNSAATKKPLARIGRKAAASSRREMIMPPPPGRGRRGYYRTIRPLLEGVTPRVEGVASRAAVAALHRRGGGAPGTTASRVVTPMPPRGRGSAPDGGRTGVLPGTSPDAAPGGQGPSVPVPRLSARARRARASRTAASLAMPGWMPSAGRLVPSLRSRKTHGSPERRLTRRISAQASRRVRVMLTTVTPSSSATTLGRLSRTRTPRKSAAVRTKLARSPVPASPASSPPG